MELRPPPVPTQEMENEYIDFLQEDFKSDPWITVRFRKFTAGPKRIPYKNMRELHNTYRVNFTINWLLGAAVSWPIAVLIGLYAVIIGIVMNSVSGTWPGDAETAINTG